VPVLTIFAGPNGSGKSSVIKRFEFEGRHNLLDTDAIAKRLNPDNPVLSAIAAGREVICRTHDYIEMDQSFAIETTSGRTWTLTAIRAALQREYSIRVVYVCIDTPELNVQCVRERVAYRCHDVPEDDIRRRYGRSLLNLRPFLRLWTKVSFTIIPGPNREKCWKLVPELSFGGQSISRPG
jgi:predicted ABC-type ATPase